jgi:hypothetical protein
MVAKEARIGEPVKKSSGFHSKFDFPQLKKKKTEKGKNSFMLP